VNADGRFVAFASLAPDLVTNDTNRGWDVFVRDLRDRTNILVSTTTNGMAAGHSRLPRISGDGRYVTFLSGANDLVSGDSNGADDVFVRDLESGTTTLVSVSMDGATPGNSASGTPMISADGRYVLFWFSADSRTIVFRSWASNLDGADFNEYSDVFSWKLGADTPAFVGQIVFVPGGRNPTLMWPREQGKTYQVEFKNNIPDPWQTMPGVIVTSNGWCLKLDPSPAPGHRFYRIKSD
jgi:hypothetical protein